VLSGSAASPRHHFSLGFPYKIHTRDISFPLFGLILFFVNDERAELSAPVRYPYFPTGADLSFLSDPSCPLPVFFQMRSSFFRILLSVRDIVPCLLPLRLCLASPTASLILPFFFPFFWFGSIPFSTSRKGVEDFFPCPVLTVHLAGVMSLFCPLQEHFLILLSCSVFPSSNSSDFLFEFDAPKKLSHSYVGRQSKHSLHRKACQYPPVVVQGMLLLAGLRGVLAFPKPILPPLPPSKLSSELFSCCPKRPMVRTGLRRFSA